MKKIILILLLLGGACAWRAGKKPSSGDLAARVSRSVISRTTDTSNYRELEIAVGTQVYHLLVVQDIGDGKILALALQLRAGSKDRDSIDLTIADDGATGTADGLTEFNDAGLIKFLYRFGRVENGNPARPATDQEHEKVQETYRKHLEIIARHLGV